MSDLRDLPDLAGAVRDRAVIPPYDAVTHRVRLRRRRTAAGVLAATALVVGGLAAWQSASSVSAGPEPSGSTTGTPLPDTDESMWRSVVDGDRVHVFEYAGGYDGSVAVIWRSLVQPEPTFALVIRDAAGTVHGRRLVAPVDLTPVTGGWVGVRGSTGWFIGTDGSWTSLPTPAEPRSPQEGDVVVEGASVPLVYSPATRSWAVLALDSESDQAYITPSGDPISCVRFEGRIRVDSTASGSPLIRGDTCLVAGQGDHVVVAGLGDGPGGEVWLLSLLRSDDQGRTWHDLVIPSDLDIASLATGTDGTSYVTGTDGRLFVTLPGGAHVEPAGERGVVFATYDRVCSLAYAQDKGPLSCSDDRGQTWTETPLPGLE